MIIILRCPCWTVNKCRSTKYAFVKLKQTTKLTQLTQRYSCSFVGNIDEFFLYLWRPVLLSGLVGWTIAY